MNEPNPPMREVYRCPAREHTTRTPIDIVWLYDNGNEPSPLNRCSFSGAHSCQECIQNDGYLFPKEKLTKAQEPTKKRSKSPRP